MVTLSAVPSSSHSSPLTLSCDISGFYPNNVSILWIQNGKVLPELPLSIQNEDGMYRRHQYHTLSVEERSRGGEVKCVAQQYSVQEPAYGTINLSTVDPRGMWQRTSLLIYSIMYSNTVISCAKINRFIVLQDTMNKENRLSCKAGQLWPMRSTFLQSLALILISLTSNPEYQYQSWID